MSTRTHTDATAATTSNNTATTATTESSTPDSARSESWTEQCGGPMTFDPTSTATMGQFDTTADDR